MNDADQYVGYHQDEIDKWREQYFAICNGKCNNYYIAFLGNKLEIFSNYIISEIFKLRNQALSSINIQCYII